MREDRPHQTACVVLAVGEGRESCSFRGDGLLELSGRIRSQGLGRREVKRGRGQKAEVRGKNWRENGGVFGSSAAAGPGRGASRLLVGG